MVVIRIQERGASGREDVGQENGVEEMEAVVVFDHGVEYAARVCDPFGEEAEKEGDLEWHFEQYLTFPFTQKVRKERTEGSIREYGEALFGQVFAGERARPAYREARQREGVYGLRFEIVGSARFHRLHWEALYDAELGEPTGYLALSAVMVRKNVLQPRVEVLKRTAKTINVLVVVARPNEWKARCGVQDDLATAGGPDRRVGVAGGGDIVEAGDVYGAARASGEGEQSARGGLLPGGAFRRTRWVAGLRGVL